MKYFSVCALAALAAGVLAGPARAEREPDVAATAQIKVTPARPAMFAATSAAHARKMTPQQREERRFLKEAAAASRFESEAARLALTRSNDAGVRSFAANLINHHASAGPTLQHMLHGRGMAPPMLGNDQRKTLNRLAKLGGTKFDREFMDEVGMKVQQDDLLLYERAAEASGDPQLKAWIGRTLPTLRYHLATAERLTGGQARQAKAAAAHATPARQAVTRIIKAPPQGPFPARSDVATQFMGAGPMQLGVTQPVAVRVNESNTR
jgi:predicted outer membrane protein